MQVARTRRPVVGCALALVLSLGLVACGSGDDGGDREPPSSASSSEPTDASDVLELTVDPAAADARCMVPSAEVLATQDTAFEGTVTDVSGGTATLAVEEWFSEGDDADTVAVSTPDERLQELLVAVDFQEGRTYLVSSLDGRVSLCGFTGESNPELEALYAAAFPG